METPTALPIRARARFSVARLRLIVFAWFLVFGLGACAHYQLGTGSTVSFRTLYVAPVENKTLLPQARALLSTQLRETLLRDGRVTLVDSPASADATLQVVISDYHREIAAVREDDTGLARKFNLVLGTICTLRDNRAGKVLLRTGPSTRPGKPSPTAASSSPNTRRCPCSPRRFPLESPAPPWTCGKRSKAGAVRTGQSGIELFPASASIGVAMPSPYSPLLNPSLLAGDHANLAASVRGVADLGLPWLHCDIMDGHFVPNLSFGPETLAALRRSGVKLFRHPPDARRATPLHRTLRESRRQSHQHPHRARLRPCRHARPHPRLGLPVRHRAQPRHPGGRHRAFPGAGRPRPRDDRSRASGDRPSAAT